MDKDSPNSQKKKSNRRSRRGSGKKQSNRSGPGSGQPNTSPKPVEGNIHLNFRGVGYLETERSSEDIEIPTEELNTALPGDRVKAVITRKERGRPYGKIIEVLERKRTEFVGVVRQDDDGRLELEPDDQRIYHNIQISNPEEPGLEEGVKAHIVLSDWSDPKEKPQGTIRQVLGQQGEHEVEMNSIVLEHGFRVKFPKKVQAEAERIQAEAHDNIEREAEHRRDFRPTTTFTIDPWDAKDFDDGLSVKDLGDGLYEIGVHIADVSHYVKPDSELDKEARKRGFSVYLVDRTIPMLPEELSNDICSLNPNTDRLAFSAVFQLTDSGQVKDRWFGRTVIHSDRRFSYEEAQAVLDNDEGPYLKELQVVNSIAKELSNQRFADGAIDFETDEVEIELNENNEPKKIYKKERLDTHKLIEEFMLLANREVAKHISDKQKKGRGRFIYRVHDRPDPEKIEALSIFAKALGHTLEPDRQGSVSSEAMNRLLNDIKGETGEDMLKIAAIRSMAKAEYSVKNIGHYGLSFQYYTHFTSPIRRYPDLMVHRILGKYTAGEKLRDEDFAQLKQIAEETSQQEIEAAWAERDSVKYKQVEYMLKHTDEVFSGVISGVSERGLFVAEESTGAEGMIRLSNLGDDYYALDESGYGVTGKNTGQSYQLGDEVKIKVTGGNLDRKQLDYQLVEKRS